MDTTEPAKDTLEEVKSATHEYNKHHSIKQ